MKTILVIAFFGWACCTYAKPLEQWDDLDKKIWLTLGAPNRDKKDTSWVTPELRPVVIQRLLDMSNEDENGSGKKDAEEMLLTLEHTETLQRIVADLQEKPFGYYSFAGVKASAIPHIMPLVYHGSSAPPVGEELEREVVYLPTREYAMNVVLEMVIRTLEFPEETRKWADNVFSSPFNASVDRRADLVIQWWERNQTAIIEKRYAEATWLPRYKGKPSTLDRHELAETAEDEERARSERISKRENRVIDKDAQPPRANSPWLWAGAILSFFLAAVYCLKRGRFLAK